MEKIKLEGQISLATLAAALDLTDPQHCRGRLNWFLNLENAELQINSVEASKLAQAARRYRQGTVCKDKDCRVWVLVTKDATFGTMRMIQSYLSDMVDMQIFRDKDSVITALRAANLPLTA